MLNPCPRHVLCPEGTGTESPGVNYSSEHVDFPEYHGRYYPPSPYGFYTACMGRCVSFVSQLDADLCAQRLGQLCLNNGGGTGPGSPNPTKPPKTIFCNGPQVCTIPSTGRTVFIPAGMFCANSQAEADAEAVSFINKLQKDPATPPGPTVLPSPGPSVPPTNTGIPKPTPQPNKPPPPPTSQCKPCDDTAAVSSFSVVCNIPANTETMYFESPALKCGQWRFSVVTNDPGSVDDGESTIVAYLAVANPERSVIDRTTLDDCPEMSWNNPCSPGACTAPRTTLQWGFFPGCCATTATECSYVECQTIGETDWLVVLRWFYNCGLFTGNSSKKFTMNGTWLGPLPPP